MHPIQLLSSALVALDQNPTQHGQRLGFFSDHCKSCESGGGGCGGRSHALSAPKTIVLAPAAMSALGSSAALFDGATSGRSHVSKTINPTRILSNTLRYRKTAGRRNRDGSQNPMYDSHIRGEYSVEYN